MKTDTLMWLLLVVFMLHEFEEIIMMKPWITRNMREVEQRFPAAAERFLSNIKCLSTSSFTLVIVLEFVALSIGVFLAVELQIYALWTSVLVVFFVHIIFHVFSFVVYRKYVPVIITSLLSLPYGVYAVYCVKDNALFWSGFAQWFIIAVVLTAFVFIGGFRLAGCFEKWLQRNCDGV